MSYALISFVALMLVGCICANGALLSLRVRERFGFPDHQVLKRRRLPADSTSRGGLFYSLVGLCAGTGAALVHGFDLPSCLITATGSLLAGYIISQHRVRELGEAYLKRAYENVHACEFAGAIQDANEAWRCGRRYREEAQTLVLAAKELRLTKEASREVRLATADSRPQQDRRKRSRIGLN
jgi:hypothetical protein